MINFSKFFGAKNNTFFKKDGYRGKKTGIPFNHFHVFTQFLSIDEKPHMKPFPEVDYLRKKSLMPFFRRKKKINYNIKIKFVIS